MGMCKGSGGIKRVYDWDSLPEEGQEPNSRMDLFKNGELVESRCFGPDGRAIHARDYRDHGNPKRHPEVPHDHRYDWSKKPPRQPWESPDYKNFPPIPNLGAN